MKIGSYVLTASSAEGVNVSNLAITMNASSTNFQNLKVMVNGAQFGTTRPTLTGSDVVTFSGSSPINVPSGGSTIVDVYADILSNASTISYSTVTRLTSCTGTGAMTYTAISCSLVSSGNGQTITVSSGPSLTVALSSATAPAKQVVMGSTVNSLATFRFTETSNVEAVKLQTIVVTVSSTNGATQPSITQVGLYNNGSLVAGPVQPIASGSNWTLTYNPTNTIVVPQNGSLELEAKGNVATFASGGAESNKIYKLKIASSTTDIKAFGQSSNTALDTSTISLSSATGNALTVLRTKLTLSASTIGSTSGRVRTAVDDLANLVFAADAGYDATVNTVTLTFSGSAISGASAFAVHLIDPNTGSDWSGLSTNGVNCSQTNNSCSIPFSFTTIPTISAGTSKTIKVRTDSSGFFQAANVSPGLSVLVNTAGAVGWGDGSTTAGLELESTVVPISVTTVQYSQ